jgi:hypothetical protein
MRGWLGSVESSNKGERRRSGGHERREYGVKRGGAQGRVTVVASVVG